MTGETRVAVCVSGQFRTLGRCVAGLLGMFPGADVFAHFWEPSDAAIVQRLRPVAWVSQPQTDFASLTANRGPQFPTDNPVTVASMYCSLHLADRLRRSHENSQGFRYDAVVRVRGDFIPDPETSYGFLLDLLRPKRIIVPNAVIRGLNDHFAIGDSEAMGVYADAYLGMLDTSRPYRFAPHQLLDRHCREHGLEAVKEAIPYVLVRQRAAHLDTYPAIVADFLATENPINQQYVLRNRR